MPGIAGFIGEKESNTSKKLNDMATSMSYGGFYHIETREYKNYHTCSALLESGNKGVFENDNIIITFYGEIFKINAFKPLCEMPIVNAEDIYSHIDKYGFDVVKGFNGAFAIACYYKKLRILKLATDRMSIHRIYYWAKDGVFAYASECKAFYHLDSFEAKPDYIGIGELLTNRFCSGERTFWEGVKTIRPGSILTLEGNDVNTETFWDGKYERSESEKDEECVENLYHTILDAVKIRVPNADLAMGLSGGCDARTILSMLPVSGDRIHSYTYGPSNSGDVVCAKKLAEVFGTDEEVVSFSDEDLIKNAKEVVLRTDGTAEADLFFHIKMTELKRAKAVYEISSVPGDAISGKMNAETELLFWGDKSYVSPDSKDNLFRKIYQRGLAGKPNLNDDRIFRREFVSNFKDVIEEDYINACRQRCTSEKLSGILFQHQLLTATTGRTLPVMAGVPATMITVRLPFLDNDVLDCCGSMSAKMWRFQWAYLSMIERKLPKAASVPHYVVGTNISPKMNNRFMYLKLKDYFLRKIRIQEKNTFLSDTYDFKREIIQCDEHEYVTDTICRKHTLNDFLFEPVSRDEVVGMLKAARKGDQKEYQKIQCRFNAAVLSECFFEGR